MTQRARCAAAGLAVLTALTLSSCSMLDRVSGVDPSASPTPQVSPSVWVSKGRKNDVGTATAHLVRATDLKGFKLSPLTVGSTTKGVRPAACSALLGPALGVVEKARGRASTSFVSVSGSTAIAHTVAVYPSAEAASKILGRATGLARTCRSMTTYGQKLTVRSTRSTIGSQPAVVLTQRQKGGVETITVIVNDDLVSVLAVAALLPGPDQKIVQTAATAAANRLAPTSADVPAD